MKYSTVKTLLFQGFCTTPHSDKFYRKFSRENFLLGMVFVFYYNKFMAEIISIANQKGGVGKTTTAINLAYALSYLDNEVLLIDLDPQGNTTSGLGIELSKDDKTIYDLISGSAQICQALKPTENEWLDIIPANNELAGAEVELVNARGREEFLKNAIKPLKKMYKFVFIDCPPSLGLLTLNALSASNSVVLPMQCEYYAMEGLARFNATVGLVKNLINPDLKLDGGIMTMYDSRINLANQVKEEVSKFHGDKLYKTAIPRNIRLAEAPGFGKPIFTYDPLCKGAYSYYALAVEFLTRRGADTKSYENSLFFDKETVK